MRKGFIHEAIALFRDQSHFARIDGKGIGPQGHQLPFDPQILAELGILLVKGQNGTQKIAHRIGGAHGHLELGAWFQSDGDAHLFVLNRDDSFVAKEGVVDNEGAFRREKALPARQERADAQRPFKRNALS